MCALEGSGGGGGDWVGEGGAVFYILRGGAVILRYASVAKRVTRVSSGCDQDMIRVSP